MTTKGQMMKYKQLRNLKKNLQTKKVKATCDERTDAWRLLAV